MIRFNAHFDGKVIVPEGPVPLKPDQRLRIQVEPIDQPAAPTGSKRRLGMQRGVVRYIADDFDAELGDELWLGGCR